MSRAPMTRSRWLPRTCACVIDLYFRGTQVVGAQPVSVCPDHESRRETPTALFVAVVDHQRQQQSLLSDEARQQAAQDAGQPASRWPRGRG